MEEFSAQCAALFKDLGEHRNMVLSTSFEDNVTSRMMSIIILNDVFYFQTDKNSEKYKQLQKNPRASLCTDNFQIEGACEELGHPLENSAFCALYEKYYPDAFKRYTSLAGESLFSFEPAYIKKWIYECGEPHEEIFDFSHKIHEKKKYINEIQKD